VVDDLSFQAVLKQQGYNGMVMQIGETKYVPKHAEDETMDQPTEQDNKEFKAYYYKLKPSIAGDIKGAALVISHAGMNS
jgi:UDP-N-acetylglucosamine transferase subunit ALG13